MAGEGGAAAIECDTERGRAATKGRLEQLPGGAEEDKMIWNGPLEVGQVVVAKLVLCS